MLKILKPILAFCLLLLSLLLSCESAESSWQKTTSANTITAYRTFINDHRNSKYYGRAFEKLLELCLEQKAHSEADSFFYQECKHWNRKSKSEMISTLTDKMISYYKKSIVDSTETSKKFLWLLSDNHPWAYQQFITNYPESNFKHFALIKIQTFNTETLEEDKFITFSEMEERFHWDHKLSGYSWKNGKQTIKIDDMGRRIISYTGGWVVGNIQIEGEVTPKENGFSFSKNTIITFPIVNSMRFKK